MVILITFYCFRKLDSFTVEILVTQESTKEDKVYISFYQTKRTNVNIYGPTFVFSFMLK